MILKKVFKHKKLWGIYIGQFCLGATMWFFLTWFPAYLVKYRGMDSQSCTHCNWLLVSGGNFAPALIFVGLVSTTGALCYIFLVSNVERIESN